MGVVLDPVGRSFKMNPTDIHLLFDTRSDEIIAPCAHIIALPIAEIQYEPLQTPDG